MTTTSKLMAALLAVAMLTTLLPLSTFALTEADPDSFALTDATVEIDGSEDKSVTISFIGTESDTYAFIEGYVHTADSTGKITLSDMTANYTTDLENYVTPTSGTFALANEDVGVTFEEGAAILTATYTVPKDTAPGTYTVGAYVKTSGNFDDEYVEKASYTATITVTAAEPEIPEEPEYTDNYYVSLETSTGLVKNDGIDIVIVKVNVDGVAESYNSAEIVLSYDPALLTFVSGSGDKTATVSGDQTDQEPSFTADNGVLKIRDYGGSLATGGTLYTLTFHTVKGGVTAVELEHSGFSTLEAAENGDLAEAVCDGAPASVTIQHKVTIEGGEAQYVTPGESFEYTIPNYDDHDYEYEVTVMMGGVQIETPTIDENGKFTIESVDGALNITVTSTAITYYNVAWTDEDGVIGDALVKVSEVAAGGSISFDIPKNGTAVGEFTYTVNVSNSEGTITPTIKDSVNEGYYTYTISNITTDIAIEIVKEEITPEQVTVSVNGVGAEDLVITQDDKVLTLPAAVNVNSSITLELNPEIGYKYTIQIGDEAAEEVDAAYSKTITITADTTITVTKEWVGDFLNVSEYVQLDGKTMWLVEIGNEKIQGQNYTYDQHAFFWSSQYNSYCYLIVSSDNTAEDVVAGLAGKISVVAEDAVEIQYNGNVNLSKNAEGNAIIDVNDAQLVWNMYSAVYSDITANVTVEKFLEADMDGEVGLSVGDALAVIAKI